jgi:hypothetical protein
MSSNSNANPLETGTDELDHYVLEECVKRQRVDNRVSVLITPASQCELAIQLARQGALVTLLDVAERRQDIEGRLLAAGLRDDISFVDGDLKNLPEALGGQPFDIVIVRRGLCNVRYDEARQLVRNFMLRLKIGGKLYISILGLHSELGEAYPDQELTVNERYCKLAPAVVKKYGIKGPVCLYTERNLFLLLLEAGASVLRTLTTTYGNVKGIAVRV